MRNTALRVTLLLTLAGHTALAQVYVNVNVGGGDNDGTSWANAYSSLTNAIAKTAAGDLRVAKGTYSPGPADTDYFNMKANVNLYGGFTNGMATAGERDWDTHVTVLDGGDTAYHVVYATANDWILDGFLVTNGMADNTGTWPHDVGGGFYGGNANSVVRHCTFAGNKAYDRGAGMYLTADLTVDDCDFIGNEEVDGQGDDGGGAGIYNSGDYSQLITNCTFVANLSGGAGVGLYNAGGQPTVVDCVFRANVNSDGGDSGAAIYSSSSASSDLTVSNCVFIDHTTAWHAGTLYIDGSRATIEDSTFVGGDAGDSGVISLKGTPYALVRNCMFAGNYSRNQNASVEITDWSTPGGYTSIVENCVIAGNVANYGITTISSGYSDLCRIKNCLFVGNYGVSRAPLYLSATDTPAEIENCTFVSNASATGAAILNGYAAGNGCTNLTVKNCVVWQNHGSVYEIRNYVEGPTISYTDIEEGLAGAVGPTNVIDGGGIIDSDPLFVGAVTGGNWTAQGTYVPELGQTRLTHAAAGWTANEFAGLFVLPDTAGTVTSNKYLQYPVVSNDSDEVWVWGNTLRFATVPTNGAPYAVNDYHLRTLGRRWTPLGWVRTDTVHSPCIDTGDPASDRSREPSPNGDRVNMGAYGNTDQASKTPAEGLLFLLK